MFARFIAVAVLALALTAPHVAATCDKDHPCCKDSKDKDCCKWGCGKGDPIIHGFDDVTFVFLGQKEHHYSVLSSPDTQLNMRLVDAELPEHSTLAQLHPGQEGTFMSAFGLQYKDQQVAVEVDNQGILTSVRLNGTEQLTAPTKLHMHGDILETMPQGVVVSIEQYRPVYGQSVLVTTPDLVIMFYPTLNYTEEGTGAKIRGHLNLIVMSVNLYGEVVNSVHGIMGATLRKSERYSNATASGTKQLHHSDEIQKFEVHRPEGEEAYHVASLFSRPAQGIDPLLPHHASMTRRLLASPSFK